MKGIIETVSISMSLIEQNKGQVDGVPENPRIVDGDDYDRLVKSIETNPEMLQLRELVVVRQGEKYIVMGGNMRYRAMVELDFTEAPCKVIPEDTPVEAIRAIVIKDNVNLGDWSEELLRSDWKDEPLEDWGITLAMEEEEERKTEVKEQSTLQLKFTPEQFRFIKQKLNSIDKDNAVAMIKLINDYDNEDNEDDKEGGL